MLLFSARAQQRSAIFSDLGLTKQGYLLATIHRAYNTDDPQAFGQILSAFAAIEEPIILPLHPRTRAKIAEFGLTELVAQVPQLRLVEPVSYLDMLSLEQNARLILTDSSGVQKEAYFFAIPCLTLRPETEWVETVESGWNILIGSNTDKIQTVVQSFSSPAGPLPLIFGDGQAAIRIVAELQKNDR